MLASPLARRRSSSPPARTEILQEAWKNAVDRHVPGQIDEPLRTIEPWSFDEIMAAIKYTPLCDARFARALALHTDLALAQRELQPLVEQGPGGRRVLRDGRDDGRAVISWHWDVARQLIRRPLSARDMSDPTCETRSGLDREAIVRAWFDATSALFLDVLLPRLVLGCKRTVPRPVGRGASGSVLTSIARFTRGRHLQIQLLEDREDIVSPAERFVRHHRRQTDRAISQAYTRLATDAIAKATFHELLHCARNRARRLLDSPVVNDQHPGIEALINLSRFTWAHIRPVSDWPGTSASWRPAVRSLAEHLVSEYALPAFLAASWYATDKGFAERKREWFVAHAHGASFRSLDLPIDMTRKMEHIFLTSPDHRTVEHAMRRAELLALGASDELVRAVLATRAAADLGNGTFWRTVWIFLIANASAVDLAQVGPMIDFVQAIRHERATVEVASEFWLRGFTTGKFAEPQVRPSWGSDSA